MLHSAATYVIYWDPQDYYHGDWQGLIDGFMANIGSADGQLTNVFAVDAQYTDVTDRPATSRSTYPAPTPTPPPIRPSRVARTRTHGTSVFRCSKGASRFA